MVENETSKPNCYECRYRGGIAGNAHSVCNHPANGEVQADPFMHLVSILAGVGRSAPIMADTGLNVRGNPTGIKRGWFNWPLNFDPCWLISCDGFADLADVEEGECDTYS